MGGSGGTSNCVVNSTNPSGDTLGSCTTGETTTGSTYGNISLTNDGWPSPTWQSQSGVTGTSNLTQRAIPDVSFFAGDGALDSATLICVSLEGSCVTSAPANETTEPTAQEIGGTSVAAPEMAGVMALVDQKADTPQGQGNPDPVLYKLASEDSSSGCSAETVTNSSSCYFQDIDNGPTAASGSPAYTGAQTNSMPCDLNNSPEGGDIDGYYQGVTSPNCTALNSGDATIGVGTLVTTQGGTTPAYNSATGYDMATGLGSLNVANVVNATGVWLVSGTNTATMTVTLSPTGNISASTALTVSAAVTGSEGTPTGSVTVVGGGSNGTGALNSSGDASITIPPSSLSPGSITLTITYSGDKTYAPTNQTETVNVTAAVPTVTVDAPAGGNIANSVYVSVTVSGPAGAAVPTGTVTLAGGGYNSTAVTLSSSGIAAFTIPANTLAVGTDTLTATYSGSSTYAGAAGTASIDIVSSATATPKVTVTPLPATIENTQTLSVSVSVTGTASSPPTGDVTLSSSSFTSSYTATSPILTLALTNGSATFSLPANALQPGSDTLTATYSGDANYASTQGTGAVTVTQATYTLATPTVSPSSVSPGGTATVTISGNQSTSGYGGTVTLSSCALTSEPSGYSTSAPITCTPGASTIAYASGTPTGSLTATVATTTSSISALAYPKAGRGKGLGGKALTGAGGGAMLAFLVFLGIPSRRRWRSMLGLVALLAVLGGLSACGSGSSGTIVPGTAAGTYTFTVTGTGNDSSQTTATTTFNVTVN